MFTYILNFYIDHAIHIGEVARKNRNCGHQDFLLAYTFDLQNHWFEKIDGVHNEGKDPSNNPSRSRNHSETPKTALFRCHVVVSKCNCILWLSEA